jgi:hypothetical protein
LTLVLFEALRVAAAILTCARSRRYSHLASSLMKIDAATSLFGFASHSSRLSHNSDEHRWQQLLPRHIAIAFWNCTGAHALKAVDKRFTKQLQKHSARRSKAKIFVLLPIRLKQHQNHQNAAPDTSVHVTVKNAKQK